MSLEEHLERFRLLKYGGLGLVFLGLVVVLTLVIGDAEGLPRRLWARYVVFLERKLRLMFVWTPGDHIAAGQAAAIGVILALGIGVSLPFWWAFAVLQELSLGRTRKQALTDFGKRTPSAAVTEFVAALVQAEDRGNPVAEVLQIQAGVSRMRRTVNAEEAAAKAGVKMVGPLFLLFACIMLLVMGPMVLKLAQQSD